MKRYIKSNTYEDDTIVIETGLTDPQAQDILRAVIGQLSDGIWENSYRMEKYWRNLDVDGSKIIFYNRGPFYGKSEDELRKWYANKIKQIVKQEEQWNGPEYKWSRDNTTVSDYLDYNSGATVQDAYRVYDSLLGRKSRIPSPQESN